MDRRREGDENFKPISQTNMHLTWYREESKIEGWQTENEDMKDDVCRKNQQNTKTNKHKPTAMQMEWMAMKDMLQFCGVQRNARAKSGARGEGNVNTYYEREKKSCGGSP